MIGLLKALLPKEYRAMLDLGMHIVSQFDTKDEALAFAQLLASSMKNGHVSMTEWARIGSASGITKKPKNK